MHQSTKKEGPGRKGETTAGEGRGVGHICLAEVGE